VEAIAYGGPITSPPRTVRLVDFVIPVLNEENSLERCVTTLSAFLSASFPYPWRITVVDNGSTDRTWEIAQKLAESADTVHAIRLDRPGKGAAVRTAWLSSPADILAYMDVDLSTGLSAILPLVASLASGHSDISVGTRLSSGSRIRRSVKREVISRAWHWFLRRTVGLNSTDTTCGFKAVWAESVRPLLEKVNDDGWFFDTELILLAEYHGLRVTEVPVDWVEDADSRVRIGRTALADLLGLARVIRVVSAGEPIVRRIDLRWYALIGAISTVAHLGLYLWLRTMWPVALANLGALAIVGMCNTEAHRRWTFNQHPHVRLHLRALLVTAIGYTTSTLALVATAPFGLDPVALIAASALTMVLRLALLNRWVFTGAPREGGHGHRHDLAR